jgi:hypothetical protein
MYHLSPGWWPAPLQHICEDPAEAQAPPADALVADDDPTRRQDQLNIMEAQTEAVKSRTACWMTSGGKRKPR